MKISFNTIYILLGGNLGKIEESFSMCRSLIADEIGEISNKSRLYKSEAWGFESSDFFLNQVLEISTLHSPSKLLAITQSIEIEVGRKKKTLTNEFESRKIDVDILYFNSDIIKSEKLIIPHYALHERKFTLLPLVEIAPNYIHPVLQTSNTILLQNCSDKSEVTSI